MQSTFIWETALFKDKWLEFLHSYQQCQLCGVRLPSRLVRSQEHINDVNFCIHYKNERKSEQAHIPHAPTLLENAVWMAIPSMSDRQSEEKRGYKLLLKRIKSAFPVKMHIYTLCPSWLHSFTQFCWAVSVELRWATVSVVSFIFVKFLSSKRA